MTWLHWAALAVALGSHSLWLGLVAAILTVSGWVYKRQALLGLVLVAVIIGSARHYWYLSSLKSRLKIGLIEQSVQLVAPPDVRDFYSFLTVKLDSPPHTLYRVKTSRYFSGEVGDKLFIKGEAKVPTNKPDEFNYARYLNRYGISATIDYPKIRPLEKGSGWNISRDLAKLRRWLETCLNRLLPEPEASFLAGLLAGSRRAISEEVLNNLKQTGTTHIIAVSGANIVMMSRWIAYIVGFFTRFKGVRLALTLAAIWLFVIFTGLSAAAVRGGIAATLSYLAQYGYRTAAPAGVLILPAAATLFVNPLMATDIGWQLSFAAFSGILYLSPFLNSVLLKGRSPGLIVSTIIETLGATIMTLPITLYHFGAFSWSALLVNPLILWLVSPATLIGGLSALFSVCFPFLLPLFTYLALIPLRLILQIVAWFSLLPGYVQL